MYSIAVLCIFCYLSVFNGHVVSEILSPDGGCEELLDSFARATANYTMCTIQHARPIRVCEECIDSYLEVERRYNQILKLYDEHDKQCKLELMNLDRLQVVEKAYHFVQDLWRKASCSECFKKDEKGNIISNLTDTTQKLLLLHELTNACILNNQNTSENTSQIACDQCKEDYLILNNFYNHHKAVCMDVVDLINITRYKWSTTLGCCLDRKKLDVPFFLSTTALCLLPVLFYVTLYFCSKNPDHTVILEQNRWKSGSTNIFS